MSKKFLIKPWKQEQSPVGRVVSQALPMVDLIPTLIYLLKQLIVQWKYLCQFFKTIEHLFYACLRRDEGNPTYGFLSFSAKLYFMPILFNGALENSTLQIF
jgi:hypothetical protein